MTATYSVSIGNHTLAANKNHISILNGAGSGKIMKVVVAEAYVKNTVAIVGISVALEIVRITAHAGTVTLTPDKYDTTSPDVPAQVVCYDNPSSATATGNALAAGNTYADETSQQPQMNFVQNDGDGIRKQITVREGQGIVLRQGPYGTIGILGFKITFTLE